MYDKMTVGYQNVEIENGSNNVVYKVGSKAKQQCSEGSLRTTCNVPNNNNVHHETDSAAACNIIALLMYIRSQSPDSNPGLPAAAAPLLPYSSNSFSSSTSSRTSPDEIRKPSSPRPTFSFSFSSGGESHDEARSGGLPSSEDTVGRPPSIIKKAEKKLSIEEMWSLAASDYSADDSGDEVKSALSHFRDQFEGGGGCPELIEAYVSRPDSSSRLLFPVRPHHETRGDGPELSSSSSSSIGGCDDSSSSEDDDGSCECSSGDMEVESAPRGGPLHHMGALEASLPIKRGLSKFWNGKAKSFMSLAEVSSIEELAKPANPYAKRRRGVFGERHKSFPPLSRSSTTGISKRLPSASGSRSSLAMAVAMGSKLEEAPKHQHRESATSL